MPLASGMEQTFRWDSAGILSLGRSQSLGILLADALRLLAAISAQLEEDIAVERKS